MVADRITMELVVQTEGGLEREVAVGWPRGASVTVVAEAVARHIGAPAGSRLHVRRLERWLEPTEILDQVPLLRGDAVWVGDASQVPAPPADAIHAGHLELVVVGGPAMGTRHALEPGHLTVGRARDCDVTVEDPAMSRKHLEIEFDGDLVQVSDAGSTNGTFLEGVPIDQRHQWAIGDILEAGASLLSIERRDGSSRLHRPSNEGTTLFNRPPRVRSALPGTTFVVPAAPVTTERPRVPLIAAGLPLLAALVLWQLFPGNPTFLVFLTLSPLMAVFSYLDERRRGTRATARTEREWQAVVDELVAEVTSARSAVATRSRESAPDAVELTRRASTLDRTLWLRRRDDEDFLSIRFGWGDRDWELDLQQPPGGSPRLRKRAEEAFSPLRTLPSVPLTFSLKEAGVVGVAGDAPAVQDALRWWTAQIAVLHSPADVSIVAIAPKEDRDEWAWMRWLPHASIPESSEEALTALADAADSPRAAHDPASPAATVLVLHERAVASRSTVARILRQAHEAGIYVLWAGSDAGDLPGESRVLVEVTSDPGQAVLTRASDGSQQRGTAEGLDRAAARQIALALAPVVDADAGDARSGVPRAVTLFDSIGGPPSAASVTGVWRKRMPGLRTALGRSGQGDFTVDLITDGPHALIGGMTGAGKSELLQTLVASLATTYPPTRLNFLMIDYKGGAAFKECVRLPHAAGLVTDLDAAMARRALVSLEAEVRGREAALASSGAGDIAELEQHQDPTCPPRLLILIDEFATLVKELPHFIDGVVDIAQRGRSLGLHLVLATQRPAGAINDAIRANTNLRVALRMADEADSSDVIGIDAAAHISRSVPGRAYVKTGPGEVMEVQTAQASAPAHVDEPAVKVWDLVTLSQDARPRVASSARSQLSSVVDAVVEAAADYPVQRSPWLPPLPDLVKLGNLAPGSDGAPIGLLDEPHLQRQRPYVLDLRNDGGLMIFGTGRSGKTTMLTTIAASLAATASPDRLHLYGLDMTSGPLNVIESLPHCGDVVTGDDVEKVRRLLFMLLREIESRKNRDAASAGPDIVVLVDGVAAFASAFERIDLGELMDILPRLISDGRGVGIHFVATAGRRAGVPGTVTSLFPKKVVLRLSDEDDYAAFGLNPREVKDLPLPPGRGFIDGIAFQAAFVADPSDAASIRSRLQQIAGDAPSPAAGPAGVRVLPLSLALHDLAASREPSVASIGVCETDLGPATVDLRHGHLLVGGPYRSGRSTALAAIGAGIAASTPSADLHLLVPRRTSIAELGVWTEVSRGAEGCKAVLERLAAAESETRPIFIFVDDADHIDDGATNDALESLAKQGRDRTLRIVAAAEVRSLHRTFGGWLSELRKDKQGLLLDPDLEVDGELFGVRLPRRSGTRFPPGRGYLVTRGTVELVQVAQPR